VSNKTKSKKVALDAAAQELTAIALQHLETFSSEERERRITAFERTISKASRGRRATPAAHSETRVSRLSVRGPSE